VAESPLAKKLGIKPCHWVRLRNAPDDYAAGLAPLPDATMVTAPEEADAEVLGRMRHAYQSAG
jgi:hypothetical protein